MRKLLRLAGLVVGLGAAIWVLRERLLRIPEPLPQEAPRFRTAMPPDAAPPSSSGDDLTRVVGIGPVYSQRLRSAGILSFADLALADASTLSEAIDVSPDQISDWARQAKDLA